MFEIDFDEQHRILTVVLKGYWAMDDFRRFESAIHAAFRQVLLRCRSFRMLSDARAFAVQSAEVARAIEENGRQLGKLQPGPLAVVVGSMMNKLQVQREGFQVPNGRLFLDLREAKDWLLQQDLPDER